MLRKLIDNKKEVVYVGALILLLALIRNYEDHIFYDPFLNFFKGNYQNSALPEFNDFKLYVNFLFRYSLNTIISLSIIYVIFKKKDFLKISFFLYLVFFIVLVIGFFLAVSFYNDNFLIFYIRRFIIQPIFLLLFVPAFYVQKKQS